MGKEEIHVYGSFRTLQQQPNVTHHNLMEQQVEQG
jgi:hypothetical protein